MYRYAPAEGIPAEDLKRRFAEALATIEIPGRRVVVVIPDDTRTLPMPELFETLCAEWAERARRLTVVVALGTHPPLSEERLARHLGTDPKGSDRVEVVQHAWRDGRTLAKVGSISEDEMATLSGGLLREAVQIEVNRLLLDCDVAILIGPVFPHEVVGFSGGHKYLFPGVSGAAMVNQSHWLGALATSPKTIGRKDTPVRRMIERAASHVAVPRAGVSMVMVGKRAVGLFAGEVIDAWEAAVDLSSAVNVAYVDRPYETILAVAPPMYRELWTAGKSAYKLEPIVADGGRLIVYAPHVDAISATHGEAIRRIGYHTRDYFLSQMDRFADVPRAVLAHSSHVKGIGTYRNGVERPRIEVVLATAIPGPVCREVNLPYLDPSSIDPADYADGKNDVLVVPHAGERLYRLADGSVPDVDLL